MNLKDKDLEQKLAEAEAKIAKMEETSRISKEMSTIATYATKLGVDVPEMSIETFNRETLLVGLIDSAAQKMQNMAESFKKTEPAPAGLGSEVGEAPTGPKEAMLLLKKEGFTGEALCDEFNKRYPKFYSWGN